MAEPTSFPELNAVLGEVVSSARGILGENFVGAYLQGSFAVGDADEHSDVDFLVVTRDEVNDREQRELQALHERLFALPTPWAKHLEGSYVPRERLRRLDPQRAPHRARARRSRRSVVKGRATGGSGRGRGDLGVRRVRVGAG